MNPVDIGIIVILFGGFIWGFTRGFIYMIFSLLAIVAGVLAAGQITPLILPLIFSPEYSKIGYILSFIVLFTVFYVIVKKLCYVVLDMVEFLELEWLDSLLGGVIGFAQFFLIVGVLYMMLQTIGFFQSDQLDRRNSIREIRIGNDEGKL